MSLLSKIRGTLETIFQIGTGGPQLKNNGGVVEARNAADVAFVVVRGATPTASNDLVTKAYSDALGFQTFSSNNPTLVAGPGGMVNVVQPGVTNANLPDLTGVPLGESIVVLCDGVASITATAFAGQTIQEVGAGAPATPQTVTGVATFLAFSATTWIMSP